MKTFKRTLVLLLLSTLAFGNCMAQKAVYNTNGGIAIGFGAGMSYQNSDLANSRGYGFDFVLGSQLYRKEHAFLSVDWKFRFLAGENKAYDHRINSDGTYSNLRYNFFTYDLEVGLTLNRLRERTGIVLSGFAGAGITHGRTFIDLYDAESSLYDFSRIDPSLDRKTICSDLRILSDGDFETARVNKAALLPTAGLFLGYQFSRSFTLGIEFKTNFYLSENNSFVGINLDNREMAGSAMDRNSYVSLGFRWKLRGGSSTSSATSVSYQPIPNTTEVDNEPVTVSLPSPTVVITDPNSKSVRTTSGTHTLWAIVDHVNGPENIDFYQNGFPNHSFTYNASTNVFVGNLNLRDGENNIRIQATNQTASAEDLVSITLDPAASIEELSTNLDTPPAQHVGYTPKTYTPGSGPDNASSTPTNVGYNPYFTGYYQSGISHDRATIEVIEIPAENEASPSPDRTSVNYGRPVVQISPVNMETRPCPPPVIIPIDPVQSQSSTDQQTYQLSAEVRNISSSRRLRVIVNEEPVSFSFNNNMLSSSVPLTSGHNTLLIHAKNECGEDKASSIISFSPSVLSEPCVPPKVSFTLNQVNRTDATHEIRGSISGVINKSDISFILDGKAYNGFQFLPSSGDLSASLKLTSGTHSIVVSANNACGQGSDYKSVNMEEEACGTRINPGNADWQFCLETPSGTFSRDNLSNPNFSYSGTASSLYFLPIAGGGDVLVNGRPYTIRSGQYYLFTGNLNVTVSTRNPGSMGHWSVCIRTDRVAVSGNGNNRPKSPCETQNNDKSKEKDDKKPKTKEDNSLKVNTSYSPKANSGSRPRASYEERSNRVAGDRTKQTRTRR